MTGDARTTHKTARINLRASQRQEALLRQAAEASDTSLSEFILSSAVTRAERVLADVRWFQATDVEYDEFVRLLDAPVQTPKLDRLLDEESPFGQPLSS